ncbi:MAG: hypothetical protein ATN35_09990 [Epulopiscium sp. Nele67-Bin004]|nr:MAG: hypothetical protein ATN35_09990 [Epulopiscium sp. Nele67-Bin004]
MTNKNLIFLAISLIVVGFGIFVINDTSSEYTTEVFGTFTNVDYLDIDVNLAHVNVVAGDSFQVSVSQDTKNPKVAVALKGNKLSVESVGFDTNGDGIVLIFLNNFISNKVTPEVTITVPNDTYFESIVFDTGVGKVDVMVNLHADKISLELGTGSGTFASLIANDIEIDTSVGRVDIANIKAKNVDIESGTGNVTVNSIDSDILTIDTSVGNVNVANIEANTVNIESGTGNVDLPNVVALDVFASTSVGNVKLGGDFINSVTLSTGTGNVDLIVAKAQDYYNYTISSGTGGVYLNNSKVGDYVGGTGEKQMYVSSSVGKVNIITQ